MGANFGIIHPMNATKHLKIATLVINIAMSFVTNAETMTESNYTKEQAKNIVARTLFMEARSDYKNNGLQAVASVIWNRAGGQTNRLVSVCFEKKQFAAWNSVNPSENEKYSSESYAIVTPQQALQNAIEMKAWVACEEWADKMVNGTFVSNIGNRNMYDTEASGAGKAWWDRMLNKTSVGQFGKTHIFGYLPERDGFNT